MRQSNYVESQRSVNGFKPASQHNPVSAAMNETSPSVMNANMNETSQPNLIGNREDFELDVSPARHSTGAPSMVHRKKMPTRSAYRAPVGIVANGVDETRRLYKQQEFNSEGEELE